MIGFEFDDGGRAAAGFVGAAGDCVVRATAIATGLGYRRVYDDLFELNRAANRRGVLAGKFSPRDGSTKTATLRVYLAGLGWAWVPTMAIGSGCRVHLRADELPGGALICRVSRHVVAVVDGVIRDTHDPSRDGSRCVYGYFEREA